MPQLPELRAFITISLLEDIANVCCSIVIQISTHKTTYIIALLKAAVEIFTNYNIKLLSKETHLVFAPQTELPFGCLF